MLINSRIREVYEVELSGNYSVRWSSIDHDNEVDSGELRVEASTSRDAVDAVVFWNYVDKQDVVDVEQIERTYLGAGDSYRSVYIVHRVNSTPVHVTFECDRALVLTLRA